MLRRTLFQAYYFIIPLLIVGISFRFTSFGLALIALLPLLFLTTRHTLAFFLVMYGGALGGVIRAMYPLLPVYGIIIEFLGFVLMIDLIKELFRSNISALILVCLTLLLFYFFYIIGPMDSFAWTKYTRICTHGILMVVGYYAFEKSPQIEVEGLVRLLLLSSICMYTYVIVAVDLRPGNFFDYNWFREQLIDTWHVEGEKTTLVNYQQIGMLVLFGITLFLSKTQLKINLIIFYLLCASQLILLSSCRQAIVGLAAVIVLRFSVFRLKNIYRKMKIKQIIGTLVSLALLSVLVLFILQNININKITNTINEGDYMRERLALQAISIFYDNPFFGSGIGGYHAITGVVYPHNFFLELLSETGLVGTILAVLFLIIPLLQKRLGLLHITTSNLFYFLILIVLFIRILVSSDLSESIELFSAIYAIKAIRNKSLRTIKK